jgi:signal transduction histidine kinase
MTTLARTSLAGSLKRSLAWFTADEPDPGAAGPPAPPALIRPVVALARAHPAVADSVLAAVVIAYGIAGLARAGRVGDVALWMFMLPLIAGMVVRRRYPAGAFVVTFAIVIVQWIDADRLLASVVLLIALYTVARHSPRGTAVAAAAAVELAVAVTTLSGGWVMSLVYLTGLVAAAFFLGTSLRTRQAYLAALVERARRLEYERDQQARIAAAAERASIAREMHDIVAHSLAVIITLAEAAAAKRRRDPERAGATMEQVSEVGRQALGETRRLLGVLRTEAPADSCAPTPGLAQLDALLEQVRATGLRAELTVTGRRFAVPEGAQLAAYRIVQEALTNTIKHARGASHVWVRLRYAAPTIEVDTIDDGRPDLAAGRHGAARHGPSGHGPSGHGLVGMRERAALYDGTLTAGPLPHGWQVSARMDTGAGLSLAR